MSHSSIVCSVIAVALCSMGSNPFHFSRCITSICPLRREARVYSPQIYPENVRRLQGIAQKIEMPMTKLVNLILATAVVELEDMAEEEFNDMIVCLPARPEEPDSSERR